MSQGTVSMDLQSTMSAGGAAAARPVDANSIGRGGTEFAAHLRQARDAERDAERDADRDTTATRGSRDGGTPRRTNRSDDDSRSRSTDSSAATAADASTSAPTDSSASTASTASTGSAATTSATGDPAGQPPSDTGSVAVVAGQTPALGSPAAAEAGSATALASTVGGLTPAAGAPAGTARRTGTGIVTSDAPSTGPHPSGRTGAVKSSGVPTRADGTAGSVAGTTIEPGAGAGLPADSVGAGATGIGPATSTDPTASSAADPSVLGAASGATNAGSVVPSGPSSLAAQVRFDPLGGVAATGSATASAASAPAPATTAPQTSVGGQLAASLRTLAGRGDGVHVMTVRLHPDELGPVRVIARLTGSDVHLRVTTSTVAAAAAVSEATPRLHDALAGSGLNPTGLSVDHDADLLGQSSGQPTGQHTSGAPGDAGTSGQAGTDRSGHRTGSSGQNGSVAIDAPPEPIGVRHPSARTLDLHV